MRDFTCCGRTLPTLHDLLQHYEEAHNNAANPANTSIQSLVPVMGQNPPRRAIPTSVATPQNPSVAGLGMGQCIRPVPQQTRPLPPSNLGQMNINNIGQMQTVQVTAPPRQAAMTSHLNDEMDAVGEMEMDDSVAVGGMEMEMDGLPTPRIQNAPNIFGHQQRPQLQLNNTAMAQQALRTSQPPTPVAASFGFQNNPTVSSVNTPTLTTTQPPLQMQTQTTHSTPETPVGGPQPDYAAQLNMNLNFGNMNSNVTSNLTSNMSINMNDTRFGATDNTNNFGTGSGGFGGDFTPSMGTIDEPAKRLFSPGNPSGNPSSTPSGTPSGTSNATLAMQQQLAASFNLNSEQLQNLGATDQKALLAMLLPEEHKPFKCPVIGCEKAYKNQNGLK